MSHLLLFLSVNYFVSHAFFLSSLQRAKASQDAQARAEAEAETRARRDAEDAIRADENAAAAAAAAEAAAAEQAEAEVFQQVDATESYPEAQAEADAQYSEYVNQEEAAASFEGGFTATAVYEYEATGDDELAFGEGEVIINIEVIDEGWWRGECNGRYGLFPANYVQANQ